MIGEIDLTEKCGRQETRPAPVRTAHEFSDLTGMPEEKTLEKLG
jgi:hypothetical protein